MSFFTPEELERLSVGTVRDAWLMELHFKSETVRGWAGDTMLDVGGHEWQPTFGAVSIEGLGLTSEPVSRQITINVSGVDEFILPMVLSEDEEADQQPLLLYTQFFDEAWQPAGGLIPIFPALMQQPKISQTQVTGLDGATRSISLPAENLFFNRSRPPNGRYTSLDQNRRTDTHDDFLNFVPSLVNKLFLYPVF